MANTIKPSFSLLCNGEKASPVKVAETSTQENNQIITKTIYEIGNGVILTNICTRYPDFDTIEWVNYWENTGTEPSGLISELRDCDVNLPFPQDPPRALLATAPDFDQNLQIFVPKGGVCSYDDFITPAADEFSFWAINLFLEGESRKYTTSGARSSNMNAPFFQLQRQNAGYIVAVGWTGQWDANLTRTAEGVTFSSGIEGTSFRILPGESFRTSSIVIMPYDGSRIDGNNRWRRLLKAHYSPDLHDNPLPFCSQFWGGMNSAEDIRRLQMIDKAKVPTTHVWVDAGWYGTGVLESLDSFEGDWSEYAGDWSVNTTRHPNMLQDLSEAIHDSGRKFLLWFEPERAVDGVPMTKEHPEYYLRCEKMKPNLLLNLGNPDAWQYIYQTLKESIATLKIDVYRQDFNIDPLEFFRTNDTEERHGMNEILHINGLYRLWDQLLADFPGLLIDNCASGGRRIDIEMLRRSVALWRSDEYGFVNYPSKIAQIHHATYGLYVPYSGAGTPISYDTYSFRSAYAPALAVSLTTARVFSDDPEKLAWYRRMAEEYIRVQPYLSCDIYPLTTVTYNDDVWSAIQYNRPEEGDGVILAFRREKAPYDRVAFSLSALQFDKTYAFTDMDTDEVVSMSGKECAESGFPILIPEKRASKVIFYEVKA